jgi:hypothetical protein
VFAVRRSLFASRGSIVFMGSRKRHKVIVYPSLPPVVMFA